MSSFNRPNPTLTTKQVHTAPRPTSPSAPVAQPNPQTPTASTPSTLSRTTSPTTPATQPKPLAAPSVPKPAPSSPATPDAALTLHASHHADLTMQLQRELARTASLEGVVQELKETVYELQHKVNELLGADGNNGTHTFSKVGY